THGATNSSTPNSTVSHSVATTPGRASEQSAVTASRAPSTISAQRASRSPVLLPTIADSAPYGPASSVPQSWRRVHGRIQGHLLLVSVGRPVDRPFRCRGLRRRQSAPSPPPPICAFRPAGRPNGRWQRCPEAAARSTLERPGIHAERAPTIRCEEGKATHERAAGPSEAAGGGTRPAPPAGHRGGAGGGAGGRHRRAGRLGRQP